MKQKILAGLLAAALLAPLTACQSDGPDKTGLYDKWINQTELTGFGTPQHIDLYTNNKKVTDGTFDQVRDNNKIYFNDKNQQRVIDYPDGYYVTMPADLKPDFTLDDVVNRYAAKDMVIVTSKEDGDAVQNIKDEQTYIRDKKYAPSNHLKVGDTKPRTAGDFTVDVYQLDMENMPKDGLACYTYLTIYKPGYSQYYTALVKTTTARRFDIDAFCKGFGVVPVMGGNVPTDAYPLTIPKNWSKPTLDYYNKLRNQHTVDWGIFISRVESSGLTRAIPALEAGMGQKFDVLCPYWPYRSPFTLPTGWLDAMDRRGYVFELTYHFSREDGSTFVDYNPNLDIYRGTEDDNLRSLAKACKAYGKPILFRLNNEMNTTWTTWCGMATMLDPEIFADNWRRIYKIFQQEGVDNCIWVFNTQDQSWPQRRWNDYRRYFPGQDYVQILGLTAYNSGVDPSGNPSWRSFDELYAPIREKMNIYFSDWPWMLGEFGCDAQRGDRPQWIKDMFSVMDQYPNIKAATWFSGNDYYDNGKIQNEYALKPGPDTDAWREGLKIFNDKLKTLYPNG